MVDSGEKLGLMDELLALRKRDMQRSAVSALRKAGASEEYLADCLPTLDVKGLFEYCARNGVTVVFNHCREPIGDT